jgi:biopolymer transport protein ExbD
MITFARPQDDNVETYTVNIALFIGLALVFLIILFVMVPLATMVTLDPPASTAGIPQTLRPDKEIYLTVKSDLTLVLGNDPVGRDVLGSTLDAATGGDKDTRILLRADRDTDLMNVMKLLRAAGYLKLRLVLQ